MDSAQQGYNYPQRWICHRRGNMLYKMSGDRRIYIVGSEGDREATIWQGEPGWQCDWMLESDPLGLIIPEVREITEVDRATFFSESQTQRGTPAVGSAPSAFWPKPQSPTLVQASARAPLSEGSSFDRWNPSIETAQTQSVKAKELGNITLLSVPTHDGQQHVYKIHTLGDAEYYAGAGDDTVWHNRDPDDNINAQKFSTYTMKDGSEYFCEEGNTAWTHSSGTLTRSTIGEQVID